jgi:hypothetical protein
MKTRIKVQLIYALNYKYQRYLRIRMLRIYEWYKKVVFLSYERSDEEAGYCSARVKL